MAMPIDLVFVRHGQSEQNLAVGASKRGDNSLYTEEFRMRPVSQHRLTRLGREQAKMAGIWLRKNSLGEYGRRYVSDYIRAKETASLLKVKGSDWYVDYMLREREWGELDSLSYEERSEISRANVNLQETDPFYWIPPNGESIAQLAVRLRQLFDTLHRECSDMKVIVVCHGEVMWAFRQLIERMPLGKWTELSNSDDPKHKIHNCQILHYSRRNPRTGKLSEHLDWFRSVNPTDTKLSSNVWQVINRKRFSDTEIAQYVKRVKPLFESKDKSSKRK